MELKNRKCIRVKNYDYAQNGAYFVTVCAKDHKKLFWDVGATSGRQLNGYTLSKIGSMVNNEINKFSSIYNNVKIDKYIIMPNHIHMIIVIEKQTGDRQVAPTVSRVIKQFKGSISKQVGYSVWQKSFYDHIIRNEHDYLEIWNYIDANPIKRDADEYFSR